MEEKKEIRYVVLNPKELKGIYGDKKPGVYQ